MRHPVHVCCKARPFPACTRQIDGRRHPCHGQGLHRLREIRADDPEGCHLRNKDEAEPELRDALQHLLHEREGADAVARAVRGVPQGGKNERNRREWRGKGSKACYRAQGAYRDLRGREEA